MSIPFVLGISLLAVAATAGALIWGYRHGLSHTPAPTTAPSSQPPNSEVTRDVKQPSIERSQTSSTASITVPASPLRPLVYTVEPVNGSARSRLLTVLYEESDGALESAIQRSDDSARSTPILDDVDDPRWLERINKTREKL